MCSTRLFACLLWAAQVGQAGNQVGSAFYDAVHFDRESAIEHQGRRLGKDTVDQLLGLVRVEGGVLKGDR